jgi:hypothetical protein
MLNLDFKTLIYSYDELFVLFTSKGKKIGEGGGEMEDGLLIVTMILLWVPLNPISFSLEEYNFFFLIFTFPLLHFK